MMDAQPSATVTILPNAPGQAELAEITALLKSGTVDGARIRADRLAVDFPDDQDLILVRAQIAMAERRWADAETLWCAVKAPRSQTRDAVLGLQNVLVRQRKLHDAAMHVEAALRATPTADLMGAVARHSLRLRQGDEVLRLFDLGLLDPTRSVEVAWCRCVALSAQRRWEEVEAGIARGLVSWPSSPFLVVIAAEAASLREDWAQAAERWQTAIALMPAERVSRHCRLLPAVVAATPWLKLAEAHARLGADERATETLNQAAMLFSGDSTMPLVRARLDTTLGRWHAAAAAWDEALRAGPRDPAIIAEAFSAAWHYSGSRAGETKAPAGVPPSFLHPGRDVVAWNDKVRSNNPMLRMSQGFTGNVDILCGAYMMPSVPVRPGQVAEGGGYLVTGGVYDSSGRIAENCIHIGQKIRHVPLNLFGLDAGFKRLDGNHIYAGGELSPHPGHFLMECMGRFWYADYCREEIDSLLYFEKMRLEQDGGRIDFARIANRTARRYDASLAFMRQVTRIFCGTEDFRVVAEPTIVERLHVPQQNFGLVGRFVAGNSLFRRFIRDRIDRSNLAVSIPARERIYVSRSRMPLSRGALYPEKALEAALEREGYFIFFPEAATVAEQLFLYSKATHIIVAAGSAAHFVALAMRGTQDVAVLARQRGQAGVFQMQVAAFGARNAITVDTVDGVFELVDPTSNEVVPLNGNKIAHTFDLAAAMALLGRQGFVSGTVHSPGRADGFAEFEASLKAEFVGMAVRHRFF